MNAASIQYICLKLIYLEYHFSLMPFHLDDLSLSELHITHATFETFIAVTATTIT